MEKKKASLKKTLDFWVSLGVFCLFEAEGIRDNFPF